MTGELKKYEVFIRVQMPGQSKENEYKITVSADDPIDANIKAQEEWKRVTELRDVRVKEVSKVMTA
jgi:hypothetical protein